MGNVFPKKLGELSEGQKRKIKLVQLILSAPNLLILDEPTTHLDYQTVEFLEQALIEFDGTEHNVFEFDPRPVGFSGFMDCVTHSLVLTNLGLFNVGRYPAVNFSSVYRYWQWFLHGRLASLEEINDICAENNFTSEQLIEESYKVLTTRQ